jgi:hypothetical protein
MVQIQATFCRTGYYELQLEDVAPRSTGPWPGGVAGKCVKPAYPRAWGMLNAFSPPTLSVREEQMRLQPSG